MEQTNFPENIQLSKLDSFTKEDLIKRQQLLEEENLRLVRENYELRQIQLTDDGGGVGKVLDVWAQQGQWQTGQW